MAYSIVPFIERLKIVDKQLGVARLGDVMNYAQREIVNRVDADIAARRRSRYVILKARQIGVSTVIEGLIFTMAMVMHRLQGLIISHEGDSAKHLLGMTHTYWDTFFAKELFTPKHAAINHLSWIETGSSMRVATAKNVGAGRSQTIQALHASEVGFWPNPEQLMTGLSDTIPDTFPSSIFLESTANGIGNYFYDMWNAAVAGDNEYVPLFFPWHKHPEYTATRLAIPAELLSNLDEEERVLRAIGVDDDRLRWRRWTLRNKYQNDLLRFHQEMPSTPEEAFISTGNNIFPDEHLTAVYQPEKGKRGRLVPEGNQLRFQEAADGPLVIFREPGPSDTCFYLIGGDPNRGYNLASGDHCCAQIINRRTWEQVAVYRARVDPVTFGEEMVRLGRWFNYAILAPEIQGGGDATIARIQTLNYPYIWMHKRAEKIAGEPDNTYGFWTSVRAKIEAISNLLKVVIDHSIIIHDSTTYNEMRAYVNLGNGQFGNGGGEKHDDTVSALATTMTCILYEAANTLMAAPQVADSSAAKVHLDEVNKQLGEYRGAMFGGQELVFAQDGD